MTQKLTPWFDGSVKPVRVGVYQQRAGRYIGYQYWNGEFWFPWRKTPKNAYLQKSAGTSSFQNDKWRGLASDPSAPAKPQRIKGDPEGYAPVFKEGCIGCALSDISPCFTAPCTTNQRPEGKGVIYIKATK